MNVDHVIEAIDKILPQRRPIGHHEPSITGSERDLVLNCLNQGLLGHDYVSDLEDKLTKFCGTNHAVCVSSGTAALHLALLAVGVEPGMEVLVPSMTFVATANAVRYCGAIPHFIDGDLSIHINKLRAHLQETTIKNPAGRGVVNKRTGNVIYALIGVDLLGFPTAWEQLASITAEFGLVLIEDAAQAFGASRDGRKCGSFGDIAVFSFNNNKIVTGNGGGAVLTSDDRLAARVRTLATTARTYNHPWDVAHSETAFNYRMPNLNAALVLAQIARIGSILLEKHTLLLEYQIALLQFHPELGLLNKHVKGVEPNYWLITIALRHDQLDKFLPLMQGLHTRGIKARSLFTPMHKLPMHTDCPRQDSMLSSEYTVLKHICLPSGVGLAP